jgi:hypothetical protein
MDMGTPVLCAIKEKRFDSFREGPTRRLVQQEASSIRSRGDLVLSTLFVADIDSLDLIESATVSVQEFHDEFVG